VGLGSRAATGRVAPRRTCVDPVEVHAWLQTRPTLTELREAYPAEWKVVERQVAALAAQDDVGGLQAYLATAARPSAPSPDHARPRPEVVSALIRQYMIVAAVNQAQLASSTGVSEGTLRFNLVNGWLMQRLFFESGLLRKPVSLFWFRLFWPLLSQRRLLMPLVQPQGIYCFYSQRLITSLKSLIGDRTCLEIAAGDGTLSRFLGTEGVMITATDDHSWSDAIRYPGTVQRLGAAQALRRHRPQVVICSWPPVGNSFERRVFATPCVETYVVIGSRHRSAAGDWSAYEGQSEFDLFEDESLRRQVLPPENDGAVYIFQRRTGATGSL
jgi:hypothetical protein